VTAFARLRAAAAARPEPFSILSNARRPEKTICTLPDIELNRLLDALYQNLDTSNPEPSPIFWYEKGVEGSLRPDV
jgi:hypothetical protein